MLAAHFLAIRQVHISCVALSGALFCVRGGLHIANVAAANHRLLRILSYLIDATLLAAAIMLTIILQQFPFLNAWLTAKVLLLLLYIALGFLALKRAPTRGLRVVAFSCALVTYAWIIGVAVTHEPAGWLSLAQR